MSLQAISWVLDCSEAGGTDRLVAIVLAHHADDGAFVGLSKRTLSDETRLAESTILRSLTALEQLGEIARAPLADAPAWFRALPVNRRPRLYRLTAFLGSHYGTPVRKRLGVARGSRGGSAEVSAPPSDQPLRAGNEEARTVIGDPDCFDCHGTGVAYYPEAPRADRDGPTPTGPCLCTKSYIVTERDNEVVS